MLVTFTKLAGGDHEILVAGRAGAPDIRHPRQPTTSPMPHDLAHLAVEAALGLTDGFWGTIAAGATFGGFTKVDRTRHRTGGAKALRRRSATVGVAELAVSWSYRVWCGRSTDSASVGAQPIDDDQLARALAALDDVGAAWAGLDVGTSLSRSW